MREIWIRADDSRQSGAGCTRVAIFHCCVATRPMKGGLQGSSADAQSRFDGHTMPFPDVPLADATTKETHTGLA